MGIVKRFTATTERATLTAAKKLYIHSLVKAIAAKSVALSATFKPNTLGLRIIVGWVEQSETQQTPKNVGLPCGILLRSSTQPTRFKVFGSN